MGIKVNSVELELLKRHALAQNAQSLLWLVEQAQKAERYETALKAIVQIGKTHSGLKVN